MFDVYFVEFAANCLFGMLAGLTRTARYAQALFVRSALVLPTVGLVAFVATETVFGEWYGAVVMGLGVLAGVATDVVPGGERRRLARRARPVTASQLTHQ